MGRADRRRKQKNRRQLTSFHKMYRSNTDTPTAVTSRNRAGRRGTKAIRGNIIRISFDKDIRSWQVLAICAYGGPRHTCVVCHACVSCVTTHAATLTSLTIAPSAPLIMGPPAAEMNARPRHITHTVTRTVPDTSPPCPIPPDPRPSRPDKGTSLSVRRARCEQGWESPTTHAGRRQTSPPCSSAHAVQRVKSICTAFMAVSSTIGWWPRLPRRAHIWNFFLHLLEDRSISNMELLSPSA